MKRILFPMVFALLIAGGETFASGVGTGNMVASLVPCIDTSDGLAIWIQLTGDENAPLQRVYGRFTSWTPQTTTIGFKSALSEKIEQIPIKSIRIERIKPNPVAQVPTPTFKSLGVIARSYSIVELSVIEGVLKLPDCSYMIGDHQLVFEGSLTVNDEKIQIQGEVLEVFPPSGGGGTSTSPKGG